MIEQGIVKLLLNDPVVAGLCQPGSGALAQLPKDQLLPAWYYVIVEADPDVTLAGRDGLNQGRIQIQCCGSGAAVILLAKAIDDVMLGNGPRTLPDEDATKLHWAYSTIQNDYFDDASRTIRRLIEYEVSYSPT